MRKSSTIFKIFIWIFTAIYTVVQLGAIGGILIQNAQINGGSDGTYYNVIPLVCAVILMIIAVILFMSLKKHRYIGIIVAVAAAVLMLIVALDLKNVFAPKYVSTESGLTMGKIIINHIGISIIPLLMIPAWLCERKALKNEEMTESMMKQSFLCDKDRIFTDVDKNGKMTDKSKTSHLKRSVRIRLKNKG